MDNKNKIDSTMEKYREGHSSLVGLLQDVSEEFGYLPEEVLEKISDNLNIPLSHMYSLATFYTSFRLEPLGKHHCSVCVGTACHVRGADLVVDVIERELNVRDGETTEDGNFTLEKVNCLGACALGPLVVIDGEYHGKMDQRKIAKLLKQYED
jgi:NADH-quinone oxidoreductase subunit E